MKNHLLHPKKKDKKKKKKKVKFGYVSNRDIGRKLKYYTENGSEPSFISGGGKGIPAHRPKPSHGKPPPTVQEPSSDEEEGQHGNYPLENYHEPSKEEEHHDAGSLKPFLEKIVSQSIVGMAYHLFLKKEKNVITARPLFDWKGAAYDASHSLNLLHKSIYFTLLHFAEKLDNAIDPWLDKAETTAQNISGSIQHSKELVGNYVSEIPNKMYDALSMDEGLYFTPNLPNGKFSLKGQTIDSAIDKSIDRVKSTFKKIGKHLINKAKGKVAVNKSAIKGKSFLDLVRGMRTEWMKTYYKNGPMPKGVVDPEVQNLMEGYIHNMWQACKNPESEYYDPVIAGLPEQYYKDEMSLKVAEFESVLEHDVLPKVEPLRQFDIPEYVLDDSEFWKTYINDQNYRENFLKTLKEKQLNMNYENAKVETATKEIMDYQPDFKPEMDEGYEIVDDEVVMDDRPLKNRPANESEVDMYNRPLFNNDKTPLNELYTPDLTKEEFEPSLSDYWLNVKDYVSEGKDSSIPITPTKSVSVAYLVKDPAWSKMEDTEFDVIGFGEDLDPLPSSAYSHEYPSHSQNYYEHEAFMHEGDEGDLIPYEVSRPSASSSSSRPLSSKKLPKAVEMFKSFSTKSKQLYLDSLRDKIAKEKGMSANSPNKIAKWEAQYKEYNKIFQQTEDQEGAGLDDAADPEDDIVTYCEERSGRMMCDDNKSQWDEVEIVDEPKPSLNVLPEEHPLWKHPAVEKLNKTGSFWETLKKVFSLDKPVSDELWFKEIGNMSWGKFSDGVKFGIEGAIFVAVLEGLKHLGSDVTLPYVYYDKAKGQFVVGHVTNPIAHYEHLTTIGSMKTVPGLQTPWGDYSISDVMNSAANNPIISNIVLSVGAPALLGILLGAGVVNWNAGKEKIHAGIGWVENEFYHHDPADDVPVEESNFHDTLHENADGSYSVNTAAGLITLPPKQQRESESSTASDLSPQNQFVAGSTPHVPSLQQQAPSNNYSSSTPHHQDPVMSSLGVDDTDPDEYYDPSNDIYSIGFEDEDNHYMIPYYHPDLSVPMNLKQILSDYVNSTDLERAPLFTQPKRK
jgi:hypothetical protein